jgi:hypothetical protein
MILYLYLIIMIGCEGIKGKKNFAMYGSIGLVQET